MKNYRNILFLIQIFWKLMPRSIDSIRQMFQFLFTTRLVGARLDRTSYRFHDLSLLAKKNLLRGSVLELGSGSSTIFFLNLSKVKSVTTVEESRDYLLPLLARGMKKLEVFDAPRITSSFPIVGSHYGLREEFIDSQLPDFIYIDGPSCVSLHDNFSLPCLDMALIPPRENVVYAIDARTATVMFLAMHLKDTHILVPSNSYSAELGRYKEYLQENFKYVFDNKINVINNLNLIRTSILLPKRFLGRI